VIRLCAGILSLRAIRLPSGCKFLASIDRFGRPCKYLFASQARKYLRDALLLYKRQVPCPPRPCPGRWFIIANSLPWVFGHFISGSKIANGLPRASSSMDQIQDGPTVSDLKTESRVDEPNELITSTQKLQHGLNLSSPWRESTRNRPRTEWTSRLPASVFPDLNLDILASLLTRAYPIESHSVLSH